MASNMLWMHRPGLVFPNDSSLIWNLSQVIDETKRFWDFTNLIRLPGEGLAFSLTGIEPAAHEKLTGGGRPS
jgi:hypothetical protein